jgi:hypothetical protein
MLLLRAAAAGRFDPASLFAGGIRGGIYDPSNMATLFQDSAGNTPVTAHGDPVGRMNDISGNGNHLVKATAGERPLFQIEGNKKFLLFDGTDDDLAATVAGFTTLPFDRISAMRQLSWTTGDDFFATNGSSATCLRQRGSSPAIQINDGTGDVVTNSGLAIGADGVVTERHIAGASQLAVNNGAYATGNAGSTVPGGQFIVGESTAAKSSHFRLYYHFIRQGSLSAAEIAQIRAIAAARGEITL